MNKVASINEEHLENKQPSHPKVDIGERVITLKKKIYI